MKITSKTLFHFQQVRISNEAVDVEKFEKFIAEAKSKSQLKSKSLIEAIDKLSLDRRHGIYYTAKAVADRINEPKHKKLKVYWDQLVSPDYKGDVNEFVKDISLMDNQIHKIGKYTPGPSIKEAS